MAQGRRVAIVVALATAYFYATPILMAWFNTLDFPWMPYSGKSNIAVLTLANIPSTLAIATASLAIGIFLPITGARVLLHGLCVAAPLAIYQFVLAPPTTLRSPSLVLFSVMFYLLVLTPMLFGPAMVSIVAGKVTSNCRLHGKPFGLP